MRSVTLRPPTMPSSLGESEILSKLRARGGAGAHCERRAGGVRILGCGVLGGGAPAPEPRYSARDTPRLRIADVSASTGSRGDDGLATST